MKKYVLLDGHAYNDCDFHQEYKILGDAGFECVIGSCKTVDEAVELAKDAEVIGDVYLKVDEQMLSRLPKLKGVVRYGIGYDSIDLAACTKRGIYACNLPTYCLEDVATHAMALLLDVARKTTLFDRHCRSGAWDVGFGYPVHSLSVLTLGLVGFGNIARSICEMAKAFKLRVIAYDPFVKPEVFEKMGVAQVSLDALYAQADILSLHLPANPQTFHMINEAAIAKMKDGVMLINTSRGPIISQDALVKALKSGKVKAAGLDVVETEPIYDMNHPLYQCENLVVTPHVAYNTVEAADAMHTQASETAVEILRGKFPWNAVNKRELETSR